MISIITPWRGTPELITPYAALTAGAQIVIIDNASEPSVSQQLRNMCTKSGGSYIRSETNLSFSEANNRGLRKATGEIILFMNNDVTRDDPNWLSCVERDVEAGGLYGPELSARYVDGRAVLFICGWCIAATAETWRTLKGWDADTYRGSYWEDNDLSFRAVRAGIKLRRTDWPLHHINNYTSRNIPGAYDASAGNQAIFEESVRRTWSA